MKKLCFLTSMLFLCVNTQINAMDEVPERDGEMEHQEAANPRSLKEEIFEEIKLHAKNFFSIKRVDGFRDIGQEEVNRFRDDAKGVITNIGKIFNGERENEDSPFSVNYDFGTRLANGLKACWTPKTQAALMGLAATLFADFMLTAVTVEERYILVRSPLDHEEEGDILRTPTINKNFEGLGDLEDLDPDAIMKHFQTSPAAEDIDQPNRKIALLVYAALAIMGSRLIDAEGIEQQNLIEILVKIGLACGAANFLYNNMRYYFKGKGTGIITNFKKATKFSLLSVLSFWSSYTLSQNFAATINQDDINLDAIDEF